MATICSRQEEVPTASNAKRPVQLALFTACAPVVPKGDNRMASQLVPYAMISAASVH